MLCNRRCCSVVVTLSAALLIGSCSDTSGPDDDRCDATTVQVDVAVTTASNAVVFDWSPACAVALLLVEDDASDMWVISTDEQEWTSASGNRISPKILYGQPPSGITQTSAPEALVPGRTYELILWRVVSNPTACQTRIGNLCMVALETFTR